MKAKFFKKFLIWVILFCFRLMCYATTRLGENDTHAGKNPTAFTFAFYPSSNRFPEISKPGVLKNKEEAIVQTTENKMPLVEWQKEYNKAKWGVTRGYLLVGFSGLGLGLSVALGMSSDDKDEKTRFLIIDVCMATTLIYGITQIISFSPRLKQLKKIGKENGYLLSFSIVPVLKINDKNQLSAFGLKAIVTF